MVLPAWCAHLTSLLTPDSAKVIPSPTASFPEPPTQEHISSAPRRLCQDLDPQFTSRCSCANKFSIILTHADLGAESYWKAPASDEVLAESLCNIRSLSFDEEGGWDKAIDLYLLPPSRFQEYPPSLCTQRFPCRSRGPILFPLLSHKRWSKAVQLVSFVVLSLLPGLLFSSLPMAVWCESLYPWLSGFHRRPWVNSWLTWSFFNFFLQNAQNVSTNQPVAHMFKDKRATTQPHTSFSTSARSQSTAREHISICDVTHARNYHYITYPSSGVVTELHNPVLGLWFL